MESTIVLTNLASGGHRGQSCARPGAASRVVALELLFGHHPYADSRARLTKIVGRTAVGVATSRRPAFPQCWG
jgi:hypothetical protein